MKKNKKVLVVVLVLVVLGFLAFFACRNCLGRKVSEKPAKISVQKNQSNQSNEGDSAPLGEIVMTEDGFQEVRIQLERRNYEEITVKKGIPVRFIVQAEKGSINGCNESIIIPEYGVQSAPFVEGDNIIEFTPTEAGTVPYSCWMGMIRSEIHVVE